MDEWVVKPKEKEVPLVLCMEATVYHENVLYIFQKENIILPYFK
jgi:hypothetical protein